MEVFPFFVIILINLLFCFLATASLQTAQEDSTGGAVCWGRGTEHSVTAELHVHQETSGES